MNPGGSLANALRVPGDYHDLIEFSVGEHGWFVPARIRDLAGAALREIVELRTRIDHHRQTFAEQTNHNLAAAEQLADAVAALVQRQAINPHGEAADALLAYRDPAHTPQSDLLARCEEEAEQLRRERDCLQRAIRRHRDQRGDDRCWLDDWELYAVLPEGYTPPERDTAVELENCKRFLACRQNPATEYVSPQREIERLTAECQRLEGEVRLLSDLAKGKEQGPCAS